VVEKGRVHRLYQAGLDNTFCFPYDTGFASLGSTSTGHSTTRFCQGQLGYNRERCRISEAKIRKTASRYRFFINEVRNHYEILNIEVYYPLSTLGLNPIVSELEYPSWKSLLKVNGYIPDDFLTDTATQHVSVDAPNLLNEIIEYRNRFRVHIRNVKLLPLTVNSIVKNKFIEAGLYPTATDNYRMEGYYHFGDVDYLLNVEICEAFLSGDRDIQSFVRNFNFLRREFSEDEHFLRLDGFIIGRGNAQQRRAMRRVLIEIPRDRLILNALNDLMNSKIDLNNRAARIRNMATPITRQIANNEYRRLCPCCPTQDENIWNFG
jgi:hypothetical protein